MNKLKLKHTGLVFLDLFVLITNYLFVAPILSIFTRAQPDLDEKGKPWGGWYGTWDNPPQGDERWQREGWFPGITTGFKGYLNRVGWLYRNPGYGFQKEAGIPYSDRLVTLVTGNPDISDKNKVPGSYYAITKWPSGEVIAFEYYLVKPYKIFKWERCIRIRWGWKLLTDKFERYGFATFVDTFNPIKKYGD